MPVVEFQDVSKSFALHRGQMLVRSHLRGWFRGQHKERFYALKHVSFRVERGESLAVIGSNGAGKSTLLGLVAGLAKPDAGRVTVNGRVAALLELGSGFHPDLTGIENVRLNASLLGFSRRRTAAVLDQVLDFAGIGDFINEPLRTYSSGMVVRLAFSVAVHVDPEILLIDEVLAVGDQSFQAKCFAKIHELRNQGKSLLCVSHAIGMVRNLCEQAIWLDHGELILAGAVDQVSEAYTGKRTACVSEISGNRETGKNLKALPQQSKATTRQKDQRFRSSSEKEPSPPVSERLFRFSFPLLVLVTFIVLVLRRPDAITNPQFWAEDAIQFFRDQLIYGTAEVIFKPYAGYLHLVPRLTAAFGALVPIVHAPLFYNVVALGIASVACSLFVLPAYRPLLRSDVLRLLVCIVIASAFDSKELIGNITNVQWFLNLAGLLILARPAAIDERMSLTRAALLSVACLLIGMSALLTVILAPLAILKMLAARHAQARGRVVAAPICFLIAMAVQVAFVVLTSETPMQPGAFSVHAALMGSLVALVYRVLLSSVTGYSTATLISESGWSAVIILTVATTTAWLTWLVLNTSALQRRALAAGLYIAFGSVLLALSGRGMADRFLDLTHIEWGGERYFFLGSCVLAYMVALSSEVLMPSVRQNGKALLVALVFLPGVLGNFWAPPYIDYHWFEQAREILEWRNRRAREPVEALSIEINPPGFTLMLPASGESPEGFEGQRLAWAPYGWMADRSVTTKVAHSGQHSLCQTGPGNGGMYQDRTGLVAGNKYRIRAWVAGEPVGGTSGILWVHDTNGGNAASFHAVFTDTNWHPVEVISEANEKNSLRIHLHVNGGAGSVCFDDVSISPMPR